MFEGMNLVFAKLVQRLRLEQVNEVGSVCNELNFSSFKEHKSEPGMTIN